MKCEDFETLLADALGEELSLQDRGELERHLAECAACRGEYQSLRATVSAAQSLPPPMRITVERIGDRLILSESPIDRRAYAPSWFLTALRYAASILLAFWAGYALHGASSRGGQDQVARDGGSQGRTVQVAFADAHLRKPQSSDLAKGMMAVWSRH
jgi:anti-sigma factor RsiW